jgi:hypothetical protein
MVFKRTASRSKLALWLSGLGVFCAGCTPLANVVHTVILEPIQYARCMTNCVDIKRNRVVAETAWEQMQQANPEVQYSPDFADGFKDGFSDYLYAGGTGEPPPVAPDGYRRAVYQSPAGHQAIEDWFRGFREGAAQARASGLRELVTLPASVGMPRRMPPQPSWPGAGMPETNGFEELPPPQRSLPPMKDDSKPQPMGGLRLPPPQPATQPTRVDSMQPPAYLPPLPRPETTVPLPKVEGTLQAPRVPTLPPAQPLVPPATDAGTPPAKPAPPLSPAGALRATDTSPGPQRELIAAPLDLETQPTVGLATFN